MPDLLGNLDKLRYLYIAGTPIIKMTDKLTDLNQLQVLSLSDCSISTMPDLSRMSRLQTVQLPKNLLSSISLPGAIRNLDLSDCSFTQIPNLNGPQNLQNINMANNNLTHLLPLVLYTNLLRANFDSNKINFIPPGIQKLTKLSSLSLMGNALWYLPDSIVNLPSLTQLNILNNKFSYDDLDMIHDTFKQRRPSVVLKA